MVLVLTALTQMPSKAEPGKEGDAKPRVEGNFFNGKNLTGWEAGKMNYWRVEDGAIVGSAGEDPIQGNQFLWYKKPVRNFHLSLKVKQTPYEANAGIQFRSTRTEKGAHGYQADVGKGYWGCLYHEHGRRMLARNPDKEDANIKQNDWNNYEILAVDHRIWIAVNGRITVAIRDEIGELEGQISLQIHGGRAQRVAYKDFKLTHNPNVELLGMDEDALSALLVGPLKAAPRPKKKKDKKKPQAGAQQNRPNVIIVMTDDQGYGELSSHGHPYLKTPNLDRLAKEGVALTDFHVSSKCSPTRGALMTGRHCRHVGVREADNGRNIIGSKFPVSAEIFAANNYATGIFGKWHLGGHYPFRPQDRGFQETLVHGNGAIGTTGDIWGNDYFDDTYWHNGKKEKFKGYCTDIWFEEAMAFMKQSGDKGNPFFCYLPTNAPHGPYIVPEHYAEPYQKVAGKAANRAGMISCIDENMGKLIQFLKDTGLEENTILVFLTDNGAPTKTGGNGVMRGGKGSPYDGGHRVPFLVRWPKGGIVGARVDDTLTAHIDVLPTLIDLCSLKVDEATVFDGISFAPLLRGEDKPTTFDRTLIESYRGVVMTEQWRLAEGAELYDIQKDPAQKHDVASDHPDLVTRFREALEKNQQLDYKVTPRIIIGSEQQPRQEFTIYHWFDHHGYFAHSKVTTGVLINGVIPVEVTVPGTFEFVLRRWSTELNLPIRSRPDKTVAGYQFFNRRNTPSQYKALDIRSARLKVAKFDQTKPVTDKMASVTFTVELGAGETEIQTWFRTGADETLGAYYLEVQHVK
jgi:arylsulfatase A-like enzyme